MQFPLTNKVTSCYNTPIKPKGLNMNEFVFLFNDGSALINQHPSESLKGNGSYYFSSELAFGEVPPLAVKALLGK